MSTPRLRYAMLTVLALAIVGGSVSCDGLLSPEFRDYLGLDVVAGMPVPTGSIVILVNNQWPFGMVVDATVLHTPPGKSPETHSTSIGVGGMRWFAVTYDCNTGSTSIDALFVEVIDENGEITLEEIESFAPIEFKPPALKCGSVILVNIPFIGSPTATLVP